MRKPLAMWLFATLAILAAARIVPGIHIAAWPAAAAAALVLGVLNVVVRPLLFLLTLPLTVVTFGLFLLVLNGILFWLVGPLVPGFSVDSFSTAMLASLFVSAATLIADALTEPRSADA